jgi:DNA ligase 1
VAADPASGELRPFQDVMFRRRKYGISDAVRDFPVSMFCFELLYADGTDLTRLPTWNDARGWPRRSRRHRGCA